MSEMRPRATCLVCGGRAPWLVALNRIGSHPVRGLAGHGGRCSGTGQPPVSGSGR